MRCNPLFTIEYRAYLTEGTKKFPLDKWFCGSYKNYIPDHYQFGYQLAAWSREQYGDDMWSRVAEYGSKYPYTILTTKWALHKCHRTSVNEIARNTLDELTLGSGVRSPSNRTAVKRCRRRLPVIRSTMPRWR